MGMKPIESEEEYVELSRECEGYFASVPEPGSPEAIRFAALVDAIAKYEDEHHEGEEPRSIALVQFGVRGIACDHPRCDYADPTVELEDFPEWINRPCPKCGTNLLTQEDFETVERMLAFTGLINELAVNGALGFALPDAEGNFDPIALEIDANGIPQIVRLTDD